MDIPEMPVWKVEIWGTLKGIEISLSEEVKKKRKTPSRCFLDMLADCFDFRPDVVSRFSFSVERGRAAAGAPLVSLDIRTEFHATAQSFNAGATPDDVTVCTEVDACAEQVEAVAAEAECPVILAEAVDVKKVNPNGDGIPEKEAEEEAEHQVSAAESEAAIPLNMQQSQQYRDELCGEASEAELTVRASSDTDEGPQSEAAIDPEQTSKIVAEQPSVLETGAEEEGESFAEQPRVEETDAEDKNESVAEYNGDLGTAV